MVNCGCGKRATVRNIFCQECYTAFRKWKHQIPYVRPEDLLDRYVIADVLECINDIKQARNMRLALNNFVKKLRKQD